MSYAGEQTEELGVDHADADSLVYMPRLRLEDQDEGFRWALKGLACALPKALNL